MYGIDEKDDWILDLPALRVLCVEDDPIVLAMKLRDLKNNDQNRFERLCGICDRLQFIGQLRHTLSLVVSTQEHQKAQYQFDRLVTYLTATCIDTATQEGKGDKEYDKWLERVGHSNPQDSKWKIAMKELKESRPETDMTELFLKWNTSFYADYKVERSMRSGFKRLIGEMPDWLKEWLFEALIIEKGDLYQNLTKQREWAKLESKKKCERIADYLYDLRNLYTHTVTFYDPIDSRQRSARRFAQADGYVATVLPKGKDAVTVFVKVGLDESDIIRLLVLAWLRKYWLDIQDDEPFTQKYWHVTGHRRNGYDFLFELRYNFRLVEMWCSNHLYPHSLARSQLSELKLEDTAARKFEDPYTMSVLRPAIGDYLAAIEQINIKITAFNTQHNERDWWVKACEMDRFFAELAKSPQAQEIVSHIEEIELHLLAMLNMP